MLIRPRIFRTTQVHDEAEVLRIDFQSNIEVPAETIGPREWNRPAIEVAGVLGRVVKGVNRPTRVVVVEAVVMDPLHVWWDRVLRTCQGREETQKQEERHEEKSAFHSNLLELFGGPGPEVCVLT